MGSHHQGMEKAWRSLLKVTARAASICSGSRLPGANTAPVEAKPTLGASFARLRITSTALPWASSTLRVAGSRLEGWSRKGACSPFT